MSGRDSVLEALAAGQLRADDVPAALECVDGVTRRDDYRRLVRWFLLATGLLAIAVGIGFFIAFNWAALDRAGKFAIVCGAQLLAVAAFAVTPRERALNAALQVVILSLIGTLLALSGQVYQTGADRWQLFAMWALLGLPFVLLTRSFWGWLVWLAVADLAAILLAWTVGLSLLLAWVEDRSVYWLLGLFNLAFAVLMTLVAGLLADARWREALVRISVITAGACATLLAIHAIIAADASGLPGLLVWLAAIAVLYYCYRLRRIDLVLLSGLALSLIAVVVTAVVKLLGELSGDFEAGSFLFVALLIVALASVAGRWLLAVQRLDEAARQ